MQTCAATPTTQSSAKPFEYPQSFKTAAAAMTAAAAAPTIAAAVTGAAAAATTAAATAAATGAAVAAAAFSCGVYIFRDRYRVGETTYDLNYLLINSAYNLLAADDS